MTPITLVARVGENGTVELRDLPFVTGQDVEVTLKPRSQPIESDLLHEFWHAPSLEEILSRQAAEPVRDLDSLVVGWPENESVDDFLAAREQWRREEIEHQP